MRFIAVHDTEGNIVQLVGGPDVGPRLLPVPEAGMHVGEVSLPDDFAAHLQRAIEDGADASRVNDLLHQFQVQIDRLPAQARRRDSASE